jgi:hypothetical protein
MAKKEQQVPTPVEIHEGLSVQHDATPHMVRVLAFSTDLGVSTFAFYACSSRRA